MNFHPARRAATLFRLYERMIAVALTQTTASVLGILVLIVVSQKFLGILGKALEGDVAGSTAFLLLGFKTIAVTVMLLAPAFFVALLMVLGRLYRDHEITVLAAAGVGLGGLYRAVFWVALPLALSAGGLALHLMPWAEDRAQELIRSDQQTADLRSLKPGRFNEFSQGDVVLYAEGLSESGLLRNLFVQQRSAADVAIIVAEHGRIIEDENGERFIVAEVGRRYQGTPGKANFVLTRFQDHAVRIPDGTASATAKLEGLPSATLWRRLTSRDRAELYRRIAIPLGVVAFALLSVPLARTSPRSGAFGRILIAGLIFFTYENLQRVAQAMLVKALLPNWLAHTWVYGILLCCAFGLMGQQLGWRWMFGLAKTRGEP